MSPPPEKRHATPPSEDRSPVRPVKSRRRRNRVQAARDQRKITRGKLLRAGYRLFAERGKDALSVSDITDAAQVGFGSFYNHFDSKEAFHEALIEAFLDDIDARLERRVAGVTDVAEFIAITVRYAVERAGTDAPWRQFLLREAFTGRFKGRGIEARLLDAIRRGLDLGRLRLLDPRIGSMAAAGGLIGVVAGALSLDEGRGAKRGSAAVRALGTSAAATILSVLGMSPEEATAIANRPRRARRVAEPDARARSRSDRVLVFGSNDPGIESGKAPRAS